MLPALWLYDVGNTVARRFPAQAEPWLAALMKFEIEEAMPSSKWLKATLGLVREYGVTFYAASYHAIALAHGGVFVTSDVRYFNLASGAGSIGLLSDWKAVTLVGDWKAP